MASPERVKVAVDFGTTHTVAALVDRGNYPVVSFEGGDFVPSLCAVHAARGEVRYGTNAALKAGDEGWVIIGSLKRRLAAAGPGTTIYAGGRSFLLGDLLAGFLMNLKDELYRRSNAGLQRRNGLITAVSLPANAMGGQRFITIDAFRRAGFNVTHVLNEPSAAGFEYAHRYGRTISSRREHVLVYDLGGGTFDASLITMAGGCNDVVATTGVARLGGDDFDRAIAELAARSAGAGDLNGRDKALLIEACRRAKESLTPATRRVVLDLDFIDSPPLVLPVEALFEACSPLVEKSLAVLDEMLGDLQSTAAAITWEGIAGLYAVGGASRFPSVYRRLRDRFGSNRVHRSPHSFAATAIGLAVFLDRERGFELREQLTRSFGVWRERDGGRGIVFDTIFPKGTTLPAPSGEPLRATRRYRAAHDIGRFRFVECSRLVDGEPAGDMLPWGCVSHPFDPRLRDEESLPVVKVSSLPGEGPEIVEEYTCTAEGEISVDITSVADGWRHTYRIATCTDGRRPGYASE